MAKVCIIGTGFAASTISTELLKKNVDFICIQPNIGNENLINFEVTSGSIFDQELFGRNAVYGGGISVWGQAITFPGSKNFFAECSNSLWNKIAEKVDLLDLKKTFGVSIPKMEDSNVLQNLLPNSSENLSIENHGYAGGFLGNKNPKSFVNPPPHSTEGRIISISYTDSTKTYALRLRHKNGSLENFEFESIIFAAGAILNACLSSMLTGITRHPIGNHFSLKLAEIELNRFEDLEGIAQTYTTTDEQFLTFTLSEQQRDQFESKSSLRFQVDTSRKIKIKKLIQIFKSFSIQKIDIKIVLNLVISILSSLYTKSNTIGVRLMIDQPLNDTNHLSILKTNDGFFECQLELEIDDESLVRAQYLQQVFFRLLGNSSLVRSMKSLTDFNDLTSFDSHENTESWRDAAHYFGTVPMRNDLGLSHVGADFELIGFNKCFVVGNSAFPYGSHGHPTLLNMILAFICVEENFKCSQ